MSQFAGHMLGKNRGGEVNAEDAFKGKKVALYFSASWCGDCTPITAKLATLYEMINEDGDEDLEVCWVTSDETEEDMKQYMKKHGDYLHVKYDDELRVELIKKYGCFGGRHVERYAGIERKSGVPAVVIINKAGDVLQFNGVQDLETKGPEAASAWGKWD
eukprot:TRINITY_DN22116_c0_g1_i1.p2 TRINITY_DN22116_c0_g1~~TRINITY_DN22116_c0_g1_i1.p2  ORF type:complete len:160 (+),score=82.24 TRINITY_DN22116_c0_g1_i1:55-534(+)